MASNVVAISLEDLPDAIRTGEERIHRAVRVGALAGAHRARALIVGRTPTDMGQLRAAWKVKEGGGGGNILTETIAELYNDAPHITIVELGARPHKVSPEGWAAIYEWVRRHLRKTTGTGAQYRLGGGGKMRPRGAGVTGPFKGSDPDVSAITNAIAFKIRKYGQKPTLFVRNSIDEMRALMAYELNRAIQLAQAEMKRDGGR